MVTHRKLTAKKYLLGEQDWHDRKSTQYKRFYTILAIISIVITSFIPFTSLFMDDFPSARYIVALMGSLITIVSTINATFKWHEKWIDYRVTAEILKYHRCLYETRSSPYNGPDADKILIESVNTTVDSNKWKSRELKNKQEPHLTQDTNN